MSTKKNTKEFLFEKSKRIRMLEIKINAEKLLSICKDKAEKGRFHHFEYCDDRIFTEDYKEVLIQTIKIICPDIEVYSVKYEGIYFNWE